jgi:hypothetical protein
MGYWTAPALRPTMLTVRQSPYCWKRVCVRSANPGSAAIRRLVRDILLGIIGAIVGGAVFQRLGYAGVTGVNLGSILIAVIGSETCWSCTTW